MATGNPGLDAVLFGGLPKGRTTLFQEAERILTAMTCEPAGASA